MSAMQGRPTDPDDDIFSARSEVEHDEYAEYDEEYGDEEEDLEFEDEFEGDDEDEDEDWDDEFEDYELEEQHQDSYRRRRREDWE